MTQALQTQNQPTQIGKIENVLMKGDLAPLSEQERLTYYRQVCDSLGLNYLTRPFDYQSFNGKLTLYARKDCADQLRNIRQVSINITGREKIGDIYIVTARARLLDQGNAREDESTGAVNIANLKGEQLANAFMKAETKAKRRVTLSICGLGLLDETEVESVQKQEKEIKQSFDQLQHDKRKPSQAQLTRLYTIANNCQIPNEMVREYILDLWDLSSSKDLSLLQYDQLCTDLESGEVQRYMQEGPEKEPAQAAFIQPKGEMAQAQIDSAIESEAIEGERGDFNAPESEAPKTTELPWKKYMDDPRAVK